MPEHICPRCGYSAKRLVYFKDHINRKFMCKPLLSNNNLEEFKNKYVENLVKCELCQAEFKSDELLQQHYKDCIPKISVTLHNISKDIANIYAILQTKPKTVDMKDFGQEDLVSIFEDIETMKNIFKTYEKGLIQFMDLIWFSDTSNVKYIDESTMECYSRGKWKKMTMSNFVYTVADYMGCYLQQFLESNPIFEDKFLDGYMAQVGNILEWDLSHESYDCDVQPCDDEDDRKISILKSLKNHIVQKNK